MDSFGPFLFFFLVIVLFFSILIGVYLWNHYKWNRAVKKHLISKGYTVLEVEETDHKFDVKPLYSGSYPKFGGLQVEFGGSGSGIHFRQAKVVNEGEGPALIYVGIDVQHSKIVGFYIEAP